MASPGSPMNYSAEGMGVGGLRSTTQQPPSIRHLLLVVHSPPAVTHQSYPSNAAVRSSVTRESPTASYQPPSLTTNCCHFPNNRCQLPINCC